MLLVYQVTKENWQKFPSLCRAAYGCRYCLLLLHPTRWITLNVSTIFNPYLGRWSQKEVILDILYNDFYNTMQTAIMSEQNYGLLYVLPASVVLWIFCWWMQDMSHQTASSTAPALVHPWKRRDSASFQICTAFTSPFTQAQKGLSSFLIR